MLIDIQLCITPLSISPIPGYPHRFENPQQSLMAIEKKISHVNVSSYWPRYNSNYMNYIFKISNILKEKLPIKEAMGLF